MQHTASLSVTDAFLSALRAPYGIGSVLCHRFVAAAKNAGRALLMTAAATATFATAAEAQTARTASAQPAPAANERLILAFGDSLTAGYGLRPAESFPAQLQAALRAEGRRVTVRNAGVSGDTTSAGRARLGWVLNGLPRKPDLAILALGANDMLRGQPPARARENLDAMMAEFRRRGIPVVVAGMLASPNLGPAYSREFNAIYPTLAKKYEAPLYPFFMDGVILRRDLVLGDGIHPNAKGVAVMVRGMSPLVRRALDRLPAQGAARTAAR